MTYRGAHRAPGKSNGAPLHDLTRNDIYPCDVYSRPRVYAAGPEDIASWKIARDARCKPGKRVRIYRAVPKGIKVINPGDWVSIVVDYAVLHAIDLEGKGRDGEVISMVVPARHVYTNGDSISEWGYDPFGTE